MGTIDHGIHGLGARGAVAAFAAALFVAVTGVTTAAAEVPQAACHEMILIEAESGERVDELVRGHTYVLVLFVSHADVGACDDGAFLDDIEAVGSLRVELETSDSVGVFWSRFADSMEDQDTRVYGFTRLDDSEGDFVWDIDEEVISTLGDFATLLEFDGDDDMVGEDVGFVSIFVFTVGADTTLGDYRFTSSVLDDSEGLLAYFVVNFRVVAAPIAARAPTTTLSCDGPPSVGATVTCTVTADPSIDIVWSARTNPIFADGVVRTGPDGKGTFSFVVPAAALGQEVLVEMVGWLAPQPIGTAGGPVPSRIPAGEGQPTSAGASALGIGLAALIGARMVTRRRVASAMR
jgi:hypothetical protein